MLTCLFQNNDCLGAISVPFSHGNHPHYCQYHGEIYRKLNLLDLKQLEDLSRGCEWLTKEILSETVPANPKPSQDPRMNQLRIFAMNTSDDDFKHNYLIFVGAL